MSVCRNGCAEAVPAHIPRMTTANHEVLFIRRMGLRWLWLITEMERRFKVGIGGLENGMEPWRAGVPPMNRAVGQTCRFALKALRVLHGFLSRMCLVLLILGSNTEAIEPGSGPPAGLNELMHQPGSR